MASQEPWWQSFYEQAWEHRAIYMRELIANGERDPARIVNLALGRERLFHLKVDESGAEWIEKQFAGELLPSGVPVLKRTSLLGRFVDIPFYASYSPINLITDYIARKGAFDAVLELGCGYGQNLFLLHAGGGPPVPYFGGEFTNSGVAMARELAALVPEREYRFFHFNHMSPDLSELPRVRKLLVFTAHTIEQVTEVHERWFEVVARSAEEVHCIHLEPFGYQIKTMGPATEGQKRLFASRGWNRNMVAVAKSALERGVIQVDCILPEVTFPTDPVNPGSLLIWRSHAG